MNIRIFTKVIRKFEPREKFGSFTNEPDPGGK